MTPKLLLMQILTFSGPESEMSVNNSALNYISLTENPIQKVGREMAVVQA